MGAVQKLATVVIVGLVALATVLVVYLADEPTRRGSETTEQEDISLERGTALYITYCLQCHGPAGYGALAEEEPRRIGLPLNQSASELDPSQETTVIFQSDDPVQQEKAESYIRYSIIYGKPADPRLGKVMPAFGDELNVQQVNDLVYLIMNGDWDYVYNEAVLATGQQAAQAECDDDPGNIEACEAVEHPEPLYPTVPPPVDAEGAGDAAATPEADSGEGSALVEGTDANQWTVTELTVKPGDTIQVVNAGVAQHDFTVDDWGISEPLSSEPISITIPEDAAAGDYEFYCSVPGHKESGMVGTITVEAP